MLVGTRKCAPRRKRGLINNVDIEFQGNASTAGLGRSLVLQWIDECRPCHPQLNDQANRMSICTSARENRGNPKKISS